MEADAFVLLQGGDDIEDVLGARVPAGPSMRMMLLEGIRVERESLENPTVALM